MRISNLALRRHALHDPLNAFRLSALPTNDLIKTVSVSRKSVGVVSHNSHDRTPLALIHSVVSHSKRSQRARTDARRHRIAINSVVAPCSHLPRTHKAIVIGFQAERDVEDARPCKSMNTNLRLHRDSVAVLAYGSSDATKGVSEFSFESCQYARLEHAVGETECVLGTVHSNELVLERLIHQQCAGETTVEAEFCGRMIDSYLRTALAWWS